MTPSVEGFLLEPDVWPSIVALKMALLLPHLEKKGSCIRSDIRLARISICRESNRAFLGKSNVSTERRRFRKYKNGIAFGIIMLVQFATVAVLGVYRIIGHPSGPYHSLSYCNNWKELELGCRELKKIEYMAILSNRILFFLITNLVSAKSKNATNFQWTGTGSLIDCMFKKHLIETCDLQSFLIFVKFQCYREKESRKTQQAVASKFGSNI
ncbi:hypothetical protein PROFUN_02579 [Planoprotostelium fungivorum]|uniref:Uncharacterized protein n=1 Tax=Planoprotostelium fungivorum TaxID=1890364 RepID=A0A2P6MPD2_9EUKA|nr:hypothetical protein PROFUN_02579 [Planoprotostelium fungivorum]